MLSSKQRDQIYSQAKRRLVKLLHKAVHPHMSLIPEQGSQVPRESNLIKEKIDSMVMNAKVCPYPVIDTSITFSKHLQLESVRVSDELYPELLNKAVHLLGLGLEDRKRKLLQQRYPFDLCERRLADLRESVKGGYIVAAMYWIGVDVDVTPYRRNNTDHYQVVTGCINVAKELSWLFCELRDAFDAHLDYQNKYTFFLELAEAANSIIEKEGYDRVEAYVAVIDQAEKIRQQWNDSVSRYYDRATEELRETEMFIKQHSSAGNELSVV